MTSDAPLGCASLRELPLRQCSFLWLVPGEALPGPSARPQHSPPSCVFPEGSVAGGAAAAYVGIGRGAVPPAPGCFPRACGRIAAGPNTVPGCSLGHAQRATRPVLGWRGAAKSRQITTMDSVKCGCYNSNSEIAALIYNKSIS